jgi:phage-related protein
MANVTLSINSKHDDKGIKDAQKSMKSLGDAAKTVNTVIKGFVGAKLFKNVLKDIGDCTKEYEKSLEAITKQTGAVTKYQKTMGDFKNTANGLKSVLGEVFGNIKVEAMARLQAPLDKIKQWLDDNKDYIVGFFVGLPEIAKRTFTLIKDMLAFVFSMDFWGKYGKNVADILITAYKGIFSTLWSIVQAIGTTIWEPLKTGFLIIGDVIQDTWYKIIEGIGNGFTAVINGIFRLLNKPIELINSLIEKTNALAHRNIRTVGTIQEVSRTPGRDPSAGREQRTVNTGTIGDAWGNVTTTLTKSIDVIVNSAKENGAVLAEAFDPIISSFKEDIGGIIKSNSGVASANRAIVAADGVLDESLNAVGDAVAENTKGLWGTIKDAVKNNAKEITDTTNAAAEGFASGGPMGAVMGVVMSAIGKIVEMFAQIENVGKVLNPISTLLERMFAILEPVINELFAPFVIILEDIGSLIGSVIGPLIKLISGALSPFLNIIINILNIVMPIVGVLFELLGIILQLEPLLTVAIVIFDLIGAAITALYNYVLRPIVNFIITIIGFIVNAIASAINFVIGLINKLPGVNIKKVSGMDTEAMKLKEITAVNSGNTDYSQKATSETSSSGGNSGSYTAAKDTIVNIYFNHSFVNGDAREIALMIQTELNSAHALGY